MSFVHHFPYTDAHELNLDWIIAQFKKYEDELDNLEEWKTTHEAEYAQLKALYDAVMSGNFPPSIKQAFYDWMRLNAIDLLGDLVSLVIFNITDDGYFVAYIPESWDDIQFGTTGLDDIIPGYDYGHLTLSYNV